MGKDDVLAREYSYYQNHKDELLKKYQGRFVVIKKNAILGVYDDIKTAIKETLKEHEMGSFFVKQCVENEDVQIFRARLIISHDQRLR